MLFSIKIGNFTNMIIKEFNAIGIMSGTSLDGIDLVYANFVFNTSWDFKIECAETIKYSKDWKSTLSKDAVALRVPLKKTLRRPKNGEREC